MKLDIKATAFSIGILWGAAMLITALANLIWPGYGMAFLQILASIYPGYKASGTAGDMIVGVLYALLDGALFGLLFAWLYNWMIGNRAAKRNARDAKQAAVPPFKPIEPKA